MNIQRRSKVDYAKTKALARDENPNVRRKLAAREDVRTEILYFLAEDDDVEVRATIAANKQAPAHADLLLARDSDDGARHRLAQKIGRLVPNLPEDAKSLVRDLALEAIEVLMQDRLPRVRQMLAEELKTTAHAPLEVIRKLARDSEVEVAVPVLEFSPLLTDADLLAIIATGPAEASITAISRRDGVAEPVSDAIVETESIPAIAALLANPVAQIREETLDRIVAKAPEIRPWHEPLARRPKLPPRIIHKLSNFLAVSLLQTLQNRGDLDPETAKAVAEALHDRIQREGSEAVATEADEREKAADEVQRLQAKGALDEKAISEALGEGKHFFVTEALAVLGRVPVRISERILNAGNAVAVAALAWKAGFGARLASRIQTRVARILPTEALSTETDTYPMDEDAMRLHLDSFHTATEEASDIPSTPMAEPDLASEKTRKAAPVDPDWASEETPIDKAVAEPNWAREETPTDKALAEPNWAREETPEDTPGAETGLEPAEEGSEIADPEPVATPGDTPDAETGFEPAEEDSEVAEPLPEDEGPNAEENEAG